MILDRALPAGRRSRYLVIAAVAALIVGAVVLLAAIALRPAPPVVAAAGSPTPSPSSRPTPTSTATPTPTHTLEPTPPPTPSPTPEPAVGIGSDGRMTVLLLGSDYRRGHAGTRTDTIMVVSFDPVSGATAAASIPRDTVNFPLPGGSVYRPKINGLYQAFAASAGDAAAAAKMKTVVGQALGVEIDYYAFITFGGVTRLIDAVGGVDVTLEKAVVDPVYWLSETKRGVKFPAGLNHLNGQRALIFARTRKGDNDFERARRQQQLIMATVDAVAAKGLKVLPALLRVARNDDYVRSDLPLKLAPQIFRLIDAADTRNPTRVVFGPRKWATSTGGTAFALKIKDVRSWTARWMAPVAAASADPAVASPRP
jgi:LCP family protein required for cell wall assembly